MTREITSFLLPLSQYWERGPGGEGLSLRNLLLIILAFAALLMSGCARTEATRVSGPVHVEVWSMWTGAEEDDFEHVLAYYNRTHPGVVVENLGAVDDEKTIRAIVAGVPPDVCTLATPDNLGSLAANDAIMPLDARFATSGLREADYTPGSIGQCRYRGRLYALPYLLDCTALMWNKDVFRAAGLDPDRPPKTLEEMEQDCRRITKRDAEGRLTRIGFRPVAGSQMLAIFGGGFVDATARRITADNPRNVEAAAYCKSLMDSEGGYEAVQAFAQGFAGDMGNYNPFFQGEVGMTFSGEWNPYWAYLYSPKTHYGVAALPYPAAYPDRAGTVWLGSNPLCIPRGAKHADAAWRFLVWTQSPEAQRMFAATLHNVPNIRSVLHDPTLRHPGPWRAAFGQFMDLSDSPNGTYFPPMPVASLYVNQLDTAIDSVCYGRQTPAAAMQGVQARTQRILDKYLQ